MADCKSQTTSSSGSSNNGINSGIDFPKELFSEAQLLHGAILVHVLASIYIFYVMFIICNEYLVPAIESLCEALKLPSHIAGASFLAASSSIPELCVNIIGTFLTKDDLGIGTVIASAYVNLLVIVALTGFGTALLGTNKPGVKYNTIALYPLTRDSFVYAIAIIGLTIVTWDQKVYWYEALALVLIYFLYLGGLAFNNSIERLFLRFGHWISTLSKGHGTAGVTEKTPILEQLEKELMKDDESEEKAQGKEETANEKDKRKIAEQDKQDMDLILKALQDDSEIGKAETTKGKWTQLYPPSLECRNCFDWIHYLLLFPAQFLILVTLPDCRSQPNRKWFPATLILSVLWMGSLSYLASWMLTTFSSTLGFPNSITGIFLAFGASFPEVLSSFIVARKGLGTMGLSNPIGSNTFDILICLALPWTFQGLSHSTNYVKIYSGGVYITLFLLLITLCLLYCILLANKLLLDLNVSVLALIMFIIMMTLVCLIEMNVFSTDKC